MKAVYAKTIQEKMDDEIRKADVQRKEIDHFELSKYEFAMLTGKAVTYEPFELYYMYSGFKVIVK